MTLFRHIAAIRQKAASLGYHEIQFNEVSRVIGFMKDDVRVNIYYTTGSVGTCIHHPERGRTQLFRKGLNLKDVYQILANPRTHTGKGYYTKSGDAPPKKRGNNPGPACMQGLTDPMDNNTGRPFTTSAVAGSPNLCQSPALLHSRRFNNVDVPRHLATACLGLPAARLPSLSTWLFRVRI